MSPPNSLNSQRTRAARWPVLLLLGASGALAAPDSSPIVIETEPVPLADLLGRAHERVAQMQDAQRTLVEVQEGAKRTRDVIKLNCVNDRMLQLKGLLTVSDGAMSQLNEAVARRDEEAANHEYTRLGILAQKAIVLATESKTCVGDDLSFIGGTQVTVEVDPSIPQRDVTLIDMPRLDVARSPAASTP